MALQDFPQFALLFLSARQEEAGMHCRLMT